MAYFSRLIAVLLLLFSFAIPAHASEIVPSGPVGCGTDPEPNAVNPYGPPDFSPSRECHLGENGPGTATWGWLNACTKWDWCPSWYPTNIVSAVPTCPADSTLNTSGQCECTAGFEADNGACVPQNDCPAAGTPAGSFTLSSKSIVSVCNNGCQVVRHGDPAGFSYGGPMEWVTKFVYSGASCVPGEPPETDGSEGAPDDGSADPTPPQDKDCYDKGLCPFNYNGKIFCTKCDSKEGNSNQSSSSSGTGTDSSGNPTGETGTTNTTKETTANCTNGSCNITTTTTVTNPDGSTITTTETQSTPQPDFCQSNPGHIVCKGEDEGTFGGSCSAGFQCSGDAVQCAQAEAAWKSACASDVSGMTDQINDGSAAMAAGAASGLGIPGGSDAFDLGSRLSEVPLFGSSGGCPSDVSVNVGGTSYTIAFSSMCPQLQVLGVALMAFAYLVAGFIVFRGDRS